MKMLNKNIAVKVLEKEKTKGLLMTDTREDTITVEVVHGNENVEIGPEQKLVIKKGTPSVKYNDLLIITSDHILFII